MPNNQGVLYQDCVEISVMTVGRISVHIHRSFDGLASADEVAKEIREVWEKYVKPLQPGFKKVAAPYLEMKEMEQRPGATHITSAEELLA